MDSCISVVASNTPHTSSFSQPRQNSADCPHTFLLHLYEKTSANLHTECIVHWEALSTNRHSSESSGFGCTDWRGNCTSQLMWPGNEHARNKCSCFTLQLGQAKSCRVQSVTCRANFPTAPLDTDRSTRESSCIITTVARVNSCRQAQLQAKAVSPSISSRQLANAGTYGRHKAASSLIGEDASCSAATRTDFRTAQAADI